MIARTALLLAATLLTAAPLHAAEEDSTATKRLRACLAAGAGGAPTASLAAANAALRTLCARQIRTLREEREQAALAAIDPRDAAAVAEARKSVRVQLDEDVLRAIATFTGLNA